MIDAEKMFGTTTRNSNYTLTEAYQLKLETCPHPTTTAAHAIAPNYTRNEQQKIE